MWLKIFGSVIALVGVIFIFDARRIVKNNFPTANENETVLGTKILGVISAFIGGIICIL